MAELTPPPIPIVALDVPTAAGALALIDRLDEALDPRLRHETPAVTSPVPEGSAQV